MGLALEEEEDYWLEKELADRLEYRDEDLILTVSEKKCCLQNPAGGV